MKDKLFGGMIGLVIGDALGVPVEFFDREYFKKNPVSIMLQFGTHNQPKGTWSDDSSMALCLMESLTNGLNYNDIATKFFEWAENDYMTPHGKRFGIGQATLLSIARFAKGTPPLESGGKGERDASNGSLMRTLPLVFFTANMSIKKRFEIVENVSSITHAHMRVKIACVFYVQYVLELLHGKSKTEALQNAIATIHKYYKDENELTHYSRLFESDITKLTEDEIFTSGYVVDTLEASMWCFLTTDNYKDCVLKAVNLGRDTDTVAAIAGGMAGVYYGYDSIPTEWVDCIVKIDMIKELCKNFLELLNNLGTPLRLVTSNS